MRDEQSKLEAKLEIEETCCECFCDVSKYEAYKNWNKFQDGIRWPKRDENHEVIDEVEKSLCQQLGTPHLWTCWGCAEQKEKEQKQKEKNEKEQKEKKMSELKKWNDALKYQIKTGEIWFEDITPWGEERYIKDLMDDFENWLDETPNPTLEEIAHWDDEFHITMDPIYARICEAELKKELESTAQLESDEEFVDAKEEIVEFDAEGNMKYPVSMHTFHHFNEWLTHYMLEPSRPLKKFSEDPGEDAIIWNKRVEQWWNGEVCDEQYSQNGTGWVVDEEMANAIWKELNEGNPEDWGLGHR